MEIKELIGVLAKTLNIAGSDLQVLMLHEDGTLKEDSGSNFEAKFADKISTVKEEVRSQTAGKIVKEERVKFENEIKEKFGFKSEKMGVDLVAQLLDSKVKKAGEITDDDAKKTTAYIALESKYNTLESSIDDKVKAATAEIETKYKSEQELAESVNEAVTMFEGLNPVLSQDAVIKGNQIGIFKDKVRTIKTEVKILPDGKKLRIVLNADGTRKEDAHANPITYEQEIKTLASSMFDLQASKPIGSGGDPANKGKVNGVNGESGKKYTGAIPKTRDELGNLLVKIRTDYSDPKERSEITKEIVSAFDAQEA